MILYFVVAGTHVSVMRGRYSGEVSALDVVLALSVFSLVVFVLPSRIFAFHITFLAVTRSGRVLSANKVLCRMSCVLGYGWCKF